MEAARTSETSVNFYQTTRRYNPEESHLRTHRRENPKSYWGRTLLNITLINCSFFTTYAYLSSRYRYHHRHPPPPPALYLPSPLAQNKCHSAVIGTCTNHSRKLVLGHPLVGHIALPVSWDVKNWYGSSMCACTMWWWNWIARGRFSRLGALYTAHVWVTGTVAYRTDLTGQSTWRIAGRVATSVL
jgi:hypothetical protein